MERNWKKLSKERNTAVAKANVALTKALKTATGSKRLQLIARREKLKADWLKDAEDSSDLVLKVKHSSRPRFPKLSNGISPKKQIGGLGVFRRYSNC
jgi:hypothetical protein